MKNLVFALTLLAGVSHSLWQAHAAEPRNTGPWDMAALRETPTAEFGAKNVGAQEV